MHETNPNINYSARYECQDLEIRLILEKPDLLVTQHYGNSIPSKHQTFSQLKWDSLLQYAVPEHI